jgi:hypothetical protein
VKRAEARRKAAEAAAQAAAEAEAKAAAAKAADKKDATSPDDQDVRGSEAEPSAQPKIDTPAAVPAGELTADQLQVDDAEYTAASVPLKQPLVLLYIKSGDTVMARLPVVPGLNAIDIADLPSDTRRLEAEAVLRGFQGEILDLIGKRALLGSRIAKFIGGGKFSEAEESLNELRLLKDYKTMADILDGIQRRALDESKEPVPMAAKSRIDRMTQSTRDMLQKYLENDLAGKLDRDLKKAQAAPPPKKENADASDNGKSSDAAKPVGDAKSSSSES